VAIPLPAGGSPENRGLDDGGMTNKRMYARPIDHIEDETTRTADTIPIQQLEGRTMFSTFVPSRPAPSLRPGDRARKFTTRLTRGAGLLALVVAATFLAPPAGPADADGPPPTSGSPPVAGSCGVLKSPVSLTSAAQVEALLAGSWIRCDGVSAFGSAEGEVGFEVAGGRLYRLYQGSGGELIRGEGADQEGAVSVIDLTSMNGPGSYQVNVDLLGGGTAMNQPVFFSEPDAVRLRGTGDYQRWTGPPPTSVSPPITGPPVTSKPKDRGPGRTRCRWVTSESTTRAQAELPLCPCGGMNHGAGRKGENRTPDSVEAR
jgi:hypothetical protein